VAGSEDGGGVDTVLQLLHGDCREVLKTLPDASVHRCVTSPPYWGLRDYGVGGQIGLERTPEEYVAALVAVFREVRRVLREDGTLWLNLGDSYNAYNGGAGPSSSISSGAQTNERPRLETGFGLRNPALKPKDLVGIPWRVAFALQADGWYLRQDIIWHKPNPMPESVTDRCTKAHEYVFLLSKAARYYYDAESIKEPAREWTGRAGEWGRDGNSVSEHVIPGQSAAQHRPRESVKRGQFNGKTNTMPGREAFRAVTETRNRRSVWTVATQPYKGSHFATFPPKLIRPMILAGCPIGGTVLDPFGGSGTTGMVAEEDGRNAVLIELNPGYIKLQEKRTEQSGLLCHAAEGELIYA